jgi:hypothetical protein
MVLATAAKSFFNGRDGEKIVFQVSDVVPGRDLEAEIDISRCRGDPGDDPRPHRFLSAELGPGRAQNSEQQADGE